MGGVHGGERLADGDARQGDGGQSEVVHGDLDADAGDVGAVQRQGQTRASDGAPYEASVADEATLGEVGGQAGDRRLGEAGLGGELGPRAVAVAAKVAQEEAHVGRAHLGRSERAGEPGARWCCAAIDGGLWHAPSWACSTLTR